MQETKFYETQKLKLIKIYIKKTFKIFKLRLLANKNKICYESIYKIKSTLITNQAKYLINKVSVKNWQILVFTELLPRF